jgi:hypothetical protein
LKLRTKNELGCQKSQKVSSVVILFFLQAPKLFGFGLLSALQFLGTTNLLGKQSLGKLNSLSLSPSLSLEVFLENKSLVHSFIFQEDF